MTRVLFIKTPMDGDIISNVWLILCAPSSPNGACLTFFSRWKEETTVSFSNSRGTLPDTLEPPEHPTSLPGHTVSLPEYPWASLNPWAAAKLFPLASCHSKASPPLCRNLPRRLRGGYETTHSCVASASLRQGICHLCCHHLASFFQWQHLGGRRHMDLSTSAVLTFTVYVTDKPWGSASLVWALLRSYCMTRIYCPEPDSLGHLLKASLPQELTRNSFGPRVPTEDRFIVDIYGNQLRFHLS